MGAADRVGAGSAGLDGGAVVGAVVGAGTAAVVGARVGTEAGVEVTEGRTVADLVDAVGLGTAASTTGKSSCRVRLRKDGAAITANNPNVTPAATQEAAVADRRASSRRTTAEATTTPTVAS